MTRYLLDTHIASHIIKGDPPRIRERLVAVPMRGVAVSVVACGAAGVSLAPLDLMIAAHAKAATSAGVNSPQMILVTRDASFARAQSAGGLPVAEWSV